MGSMSFLLLIVLITPVLILLLTAYLSWNYDYWKKRGITYKKGKIPFGNVKDIFLMRKTMGQVYGEIYREFANEPLVGFFKMRQPILMVRNPDLVRTVLVNEFTSFHDNDFHFDAKRDPILGINPFAATGERWKKVRSISSHGLTPAKLKGMVPLIIEVCKDFVQHIGKGKMTPVEAKYLVGNYTADVASTCSFGMRCGSFEGKESEFRKMSNRVLNGDLLGNLAVLFSFYTPTLGKIFKFRIIAKDVGDYFEGVVSNMIKYRLTEGQTRNDFLQMLMDDNEESKKKGLGPLYTNMEIAGHCMTFYLDGYNTSAIVFSLTLYELSRNPDCQKLVREEIFSAVKSFQELNFKKVQELTYVDQVIFEVMRLYPPVPTMTRVCTKDTVLSYEGRDYPIEAGTPITIPVLALHMDPNYFQDPKRFSPERFKEDAKQSRHKYVHLPFGEGPRICPGNKFGLLSIKLGLASVLMNFEVLPQEPSPDPEPDLYSSFMFIPKGGVWVIFKDLNTP